MFKNSVINVNVSTKKWFKKAGIRAVKTMAEMAATLIGTNVVNIVSLDWKYILGASATAGLLSLLISVTGIPEVNEDEQ